MTTHKAQVAAAVLSAAFPLGAPRMALQAFAWGYNMPNRPHKWDDPELRCVCLLPTDTGFVWGGDYRDSAEVTIPLTEISGPHSESYVLHQAMRLGLALDGHREEHGDEREMLAWLETATPASNI